MIKLFQLERTWGIPNLSHFCVKLETYLRMTGQAYEAIPTLPLKAPRGKVPYIEDNGQKISDTRIILNYLKSTYGNKLDAHLNAEEQSTAKAYQRLLEEHLFWASMVSRWQYTDDNWQINKQAIFNVLPPAIRDLTAWLYRRRIKSQIKGHGIGRLTLEEIFDLGREDIDSLANFLGNKPYFMGDKPTSLDASAYGILINTLGCPIESPLKEHALSYENLPNYCRRMQAEFFPELPWGSN